MTLTSCEALAGPEIDSERCKGCGLCVDFCPFGHLYLDELLNVAGYHPVDTEEPEEAVNGSAEKREFIGNFAYWCPRCRYCEIICPDAAIRVGEGRRSHG